MIRPLHRTIVQLCLLLLCLPPSVALAKPQADLGQPIDLQLRKADLPSVLESFARIAGGELDIDPEIDGDVTVDWSSIPWKRALDQLCRDQRISCYWSEGRASEAEPSKLVVRRSDGFVGMAESIDMELRKAPLRIVLQSMDAVAGDTFQVEVDPDLDGVVDVQLSSTPWPVALESICRPARCRLTWSATSVLVEPADGAFNSGTGAAWRVALDDPELEPRVVELLDAAESDRLPFTQLDQLCRELGCDWTIRWGEPPLLLITAGEAPAPAGEPKFGADPVVLEASVSSGGVRTSRAFAFGWDTPSHRLEPAPDGGAPALRLTWIPFSADRQILLVYTIRCDDSGSGRYDVRDPIPLPLAGDRQEAFADAVVEIRPADAATGDATTAASLCADEPASFQMALRLENRPAAKGMPGLPTKPGNYLMVTPKGEPGPGAALVYLGPNADGTKALALVQPAGEDGDGASLRRLDLAPGETWSRPVVSEDSGMRLYVTAEAAGTAD